MIQFIRVKMIFNGSRILLTMDWSDSSIHLAVNTELLLAIVSLNICHSFMTIISWLVMQCYLCVFEFTLILKLFG